MKRFVFLLSFFCLFLFSCAVDVDSGVDADVDKHVDAESSLPETYSDIKICSDKETVTEGESIILRVTTKDNRKLNEIKWCVTPNDAGEILKSNSNVDGDGDGDGEISFKAIKKGLVTIEAIESISNKKSSISFDVKEKVFVDHDVPLNISYNLNDFTFYNTTDNSLGLIDEFDRILLTLERNNGNIEYYTLGRGGNIIWEMRDNGIDTVPDGIDYSDCKKVVATYAPAYVWDENKNLIFKAGAKQLPGNYYTGKSEVLVSEGVIDKNDKTIKFDFNRDYAQLKLKVNPGMRLRVNITNFTSPDTVINKNLPKSKYSESILAGEYIYLYGKWDSNSRIQIINQKYGKLNEVYLGSMPKYEQGKTIELDCTWIDTPIKIEQSSVRVKHLPDSAFEWGNDFPGAIHQGLDHLCWAASLSQTISWWMLNNEKSGNMFTPIKAGSGYEHKDYNSRSRYIYDNVFKANFQDKGYTVDFGLKWFLDGTMNGSIKSMLRDPENATGGYFSNVEHISDLAWNMWENYFHPNYENNKEMAILRYQDISREIYGHLINGHPVILVDGYEDSYGNPEEHAFVLWQADFDIEKQVVTSIRVTDSNGGYIIPSLDPSKLGEVKVQFFDDPDIKSNSIILNYYNPENPEKVYGSNNALEHLYALFQDFGDIKYITD